MCYDAMASMFNDLHSAIGHQVSRAPAMKLLGAKRSLTGLEARQMLAEVCWLPAHRAAAFLEHWCKTLRLGSMSHRKFERTPHPGITAMPAVIAAMGSLTAQGKSSTDPLTFVWILTLFGCRPTVRFFGLLAQEALPPWQGQNQVLPQG